MINDYLRKGFEIKIEGDKDGENKEVFRKFIDKGLIKQANTFLFEYDFESAIPDSLMGYILCELKLLPFEKQEYNKRISNRRPIIKRLMEQGIDITARKIDIAKKLGEILADQPHSKFLNSKDFLNNTEIGRFLKFISGFA
jgi:hypothetical protein